MANPIDLFSYFPGLELSQDELLRSEIFTQQLLSEKFPDMDLREGTAVRDLVIRPSATLLGLINKALLFYFSQNTLSGVTNDTPQAFVDQILSNWFLERKTGSKSLINVRLYFAKAKSVTLFANSFFSPNNVLRYYPESTMVISQDDLTYEPNINQYFIDIDLIAEKPSKEYDLSNGSLLYFSNFDPYFLHAEINYIKERSQDIESNLDFIGRAKTAISTRNLVNIPSIVSNLQDTFSTISSITPVGFGNPLLLRDKRVVSVDGSADPMWIHLGGMVDVYCRANISSSVIQLTTDSLGKIIVSGPIYKIVRSPTSGSGSPDTLSVDAPFVIKSRSVVESVVVDGNLTSSLTTGYLTLPMHGLSAGERIEIVGADQPEYNGVFIVSVETANSISFRLQSDPSVDTATSSGDILVRYTSRSNDVGFSDRHEFELNFDSTTFLETDVISNADVISDEINGHPINDGIGYIDPFNKSASFIIYYFSDIDSIDTYLSSSSNRVVSADLLARGYNLTFLDINLTTYDSIIPSSSLCSETIITYLGTLSPGQPFIMSDLLAKLYASGVTTIKTPLDISYTKFYRDMLPKEEGEIIDVLNPEDVLNVFMLNSLNILKETV